MNKFLKPAVLSPILIGVAAGIFLFILGDADDAPGLSFIGLTVAFLLIMWGIFNAGVIKKGFLIPILLFCFGAGGIVLTVALLLDGELEESPGMALIGIALGIVLLAAGAIRFRKTKTKK